MMRWLMVIALAAGTGGCGQQTGPEPPSIAYGQQECAECRMIINESRFAAAVAFEDRGRFETRPFDDIGCMLEHERMNPNLRVAARFIADVGSGDWLDAVTATYLHSPALVTPMAFHVAACASHDQAVALEIAHPGDVITFDEVRARFSNNTLRSPANSEGATP